MNNLEKLDEVVRKYKDSSDINNISRYKSLWRVLDSEGDFYQETYDEIEIPNVSSDRLHKVVAGEEDRLDLIANNYYNTPMYWWVIAEASNIYNPLEVPIGTILRIPSIQSLFGYKGVIV